MNFYLAASIFLIQGSNFRGILVFHGGYEERQIAKVTEHLPMKVGEAAVESSEMS